MPSKQHRYWEKVGRKRLGGVLTRLKIIQKWEGGKVKNSGGFSNNVAKSGKGFPRLTSGW